MCTDSCCQGSSGFPAFCINFTAVSPYVPSQVGERLSLGCITPDGEFVSKATDTVRILLGRLRLPGRSHVLSRSNIAHQTRERSGLLPGLCESAGKNDVNVSVFTSSEVHPL